MDEKKRLLELEVAALKAQLSNVLDQLQAAKDMVVNAKGQLEAAKNQLVTTTETSSGPLANGLLEVKDIEGGSYEVTFPEIDAAEWSPG